MRLVWADAAWGDYTWFRDHQPRVHKRINELIEDIQQHPFTGLGKPEPLKHDLSGWWSRRITDEHRLVYRMVKGELQIAQCRYHYVKPRKR